MRFTSDSWFWAYTYGPNLDPKAPSYKRNHAPYGGITQPRTAESRPCPSPAQRNAERRPQRHFRERHPGGRHGKQREAADLDSATATGRFITTEKHGDAAGQVRLQVCSVNADGKGVVLSKLLCAAASCDVVRASRGRRRQVLLLLRPIHLVDPPCHGRTQLIGVLTPVVDLRVRVTKAGDVGDRGCRPELSVTVIERW